MLFPRRRLRDAIVGLSVALALLAIACRLSVSPHWATCRWRVGSLKTYFLVLNGNRLGLAAQTIKVTIPNQSVVCDASNFASFRCGRSDWSESSGWSFDPNMIGVSQTFQVGNVKYPLGFGCKHGLVFVADARLCLATIACFSDPVAAPAFFDSFASSSAGSLSKLRLRPSRHAGPMP